MESADSRSGDVRVSAIVVIPTYNEWQNISALIPAIHRVVPDLHIPVVDDNSPDGTGQFLDEFRFDLLSLGARR
jgi:glycosyltransferase involved in cell wall biosynthesis